MKKYSLFISSVLFILLPSIAFASFDVDLHYGSTGSAVTALQEFLIDQGILKGQATGNFYSLTLRAVKAFQKAQGISPASGYFGSITRGVANQILLAQVSTSEGNATTTQQAVDLSQQQNQTTPSSSVTVPVKNDGITTLQNQLNVLLAQLQALNDQAKAQTVIQRQIQQNATTWTAPTGTATATNGTALSVSTPQLAPPSTPTAPNMQSPAPTPTPTPTPVPTPPTPSLTIGIGIRNYPPVSVAAGTQNAVLAYIDFDTASSSEDIGLTSLPIHLNASSGASNLTGCQLRQNNVSLNTAHVVNPVGGVSGNVFSFDGIGFWIAPKTALTLTLTCNISSTTPSGSTYAWGFSSNDSVGISGHQSGTHTNANLVLNDGKVVTISPPTPTPVPAPAPAPAPTLTPTPTPTANPCNFNGNIFPCTSDASISVSPTSLPDAVLGTSYGQSIMISDPHTLSQSFRWNIIGGYLPSGIGLMFSPTQALECSGTYCFFTNPPNSISYPSSNPAGYFFGIPGATGTYSFTLQAIDNLNYFALPAFTLHVVGTTTALSSTPFFGMEF